MSALPIHPGAEGDPVHPCAYRRAFPIPLEGFPDLMKRLLGEIGRVGVISCQSAKIGINPRVVPIKELGRGLAITLMGFTTPPAVSFFGFHSANLSTIGRNGLAKRPDYFSPLPVPHIVAGSNTVPIREGEVRREQNHASEHASRLKFKTLARCGWTIGSGPFKSAGRQRHCRLKRPGQFWTPSDIPTTVSSPKPDSILVEIPFGSTPGRSRCRVGLNPFPGPRRSVAPGPFPP